MQVIERGCALLGYAPIGLMAFVILATRVRPAATLPGGHLVRLVAESRWLQVPLKVCLLLACELALDQGNDSNGPAIPDWLLYDIANFNACTVYVYLACHKLCWSRQS